VPKNAQEEVKIAYWKLFDVPDKVPPGQRAVDYVQKRIDEFVDRYHKRFPAAVRCLQDDRTALTAYLRFPREHWHRTRHSNLIERTFGETRRRTKVIGRFPGETSCVSLVWAVLDRASAGWRGLSMTPEGTRLLQDLRHQLLDRPTASHRRRGQHQRRQRQRHAAPTTAIHPAAVAGRVTSPIESDRVRRHLHRTWDATGAPGRDAGRQSPVVERLRAVLVQPLALLGRLHLDDDHAGQVAVHDPGGGMGVFEQRPGVAAVAPVARRTAR
jgi:hypothetical protein